MDLILITNYSFKKTMCCGKQYMGSASGFKEVLNHKSDIYTANIRCGVASHLANVCKSAKCKTEYLQVQLIEHVLVTEGEDADKVLWERENIGRPNSLL